MEDKMRISLSIGCFFCAWVFAGSVCGQIAPAGDKPLAEISYRPGGKLIYVPVEVNGSSPLWFIFDTGAPNSIIDEAVAQKLKIGALSGGVIHGAGKGEVSASDAGEVRLSGVASPHRLRTRSSWICRRYRSQPRQMGCWAPNSWSNT